MSNLWWFTCTTLIRPLDTHGLSRLFPHSYCMFCSHISSPLNICNSIIVCLFLLFPQPVYLILVSNIISCPGVTWRWCGCEQENWAVFEQLTNEALPVGRKYMVTDTGSTNALYEVIQWRLPWSCVDLFIITTLPRIVHQVSCLEMLKTSHNNRYTCIPGNVEDTTQQQVYMYTRKCWGHHSTATEVYWLYLHIL